MSILDFLEMDSLLGIAFVVFALLAFIAYGWGPVLLIAILILLVILLVVRGLGFRVSDFISGRGGR